MMKKEEKLWNEGYIKVMTANFALYFAFYLLMPLLPLYLSENFNATKDVIGLVLSGYTLTSLLSRPFSGYLVDSFPRKKVFMWCFFLFFIFFAGYLGAVSLLMFTIVRTLHGVPFGALTVSASTVAIDVLPSSRRNEGIGFYGLANNIAMAIAPSVAIFVYKATNSFYILFWISLLVALLGLILASTIRIPQRETVINKSKLSLDRFFLLRGWLLAVNMVFFGFCYGVLSSYLAIYSKEKMGITTGTGTYFTLLSLGLILSRLQGNKGLKKGRLTQNATQGVIVSSVGYFLFVAFPNPVGYYLSAFLIGLGNGHMYPAFQNMFIAVAHHNERGTANSSILVAWDIGVGIGVVLGGIVAEGLGYTPAFWMVSMAQIIGAILFLVATRQFFNKRKIER
ncbi:MAG: MFS transporter [Bacteroidales bacterium]|nr:MFS transporter [Bacteroidales bacterium]